MTKRKRGFSGESVATTASSTENGIIPFDDGHNDEKKHLMPPVAPSTSPMDGIREVPADDCGEGMTTATAITATTDEAGTSNSRRTTTSGFTLRSSVRTQTKLHAEDTVAATAVTSNPMRKNVIAGVAAAKRCRAKAVVKGKPRRSWELWSAEDKKTFFEALCEYGKDFESIRAYVVQKTRKKGSPEQVIKNKDQVRHFYYRTWHKIAKYLKISDDVKKPTQELYGLINYGELRRKLKGGLGEKNGHKLNEIVHDGVTIIRCNGKNLRVKTPVCRALKRLFDVEDSKEEEIRKLPARIDVEFRPLDNRAWARVQSVAQNPRLRMNVSLQQRLSTVITYLQRRWIEPALKQRKELLDRTAVKRCEVDNGEPLIRVRPTSDATLCDMSLKATVEMTSSCVSLKSYRRKVLNWIDPVPSATTTTANCKTMKKGKSRTTSTENKKVCVIAATADDKNLCKEASSPTPDLTAKKSRRKLATQTETTEEGKKASSDVEGESTHELTLRQLLALETAVADPISTKPADEALFSRAPSLFCASLVESTPNSAHDAKVSIHDTSKQMDAETVLRGWTVSNCGALTVGEIYLILCSPSKLLLEYEWEYPPPTKFSDVTKLTTILGSLLSIASTVVTEGGKHKLDRLLTTQSSSASCLCGHQPYCPQSGSSAKSQTSKSSSACRKSSRTRGISKLSSRTKLSLNSQATTTDAVTNSSREKPILNDGLSFDSTSSPPIITNALQSAAEIFRKPTSGAVHTRTGPSLKKPVSPVSSPTATEKQATDEKAFKEQLFRYRKTKGRSGNPMVVQRELLPKATPAHSMMTLSIIPSATQLAGSFMPVLAGRPAAVTTVTSIVPISQNPTAVGNVVRLTPTRLPSSTLTLPIGALPQKVPIPRSTATPRTGLAISEKVQRTLTAANVTITTNTSPVTVKTITTSRKSFAERLATMSVKMNAFPTTTVATALTHPTSFSVSNLNLASSSGGGTASSSVPVLSIVETKKRSTMSVSPPTISSLLDVSLTGTDSDLPRFSSLPLTDANLGSEISTDKFPDLNLGNSNSFSGLIDLTLIGKSGGDSLLPSNQSVCCDGSLDPRPCTPSISPTNSLFKFSSPGLESHWFNGDTSDFSLSNLLNHLESPIKVSASLASAGVHTEGLDVMARLAPDMDSQLRSLITETSIDYIAKFEDLAAQIGKK